MIAGGSTDRREDHHRSGYARARSAQRASASWFLLPLLLFAFFAQAITSAPLKSPTFDEEFHISRAYAYTRTGDLRMQQNHPPLVSVLAGIPLLLMPELMPPAEIAGWDEPFLFTFADQLFWRLGHDVDKMLFLARFPIILLGVLLGAFVYRWARTMYGQAAGIVGTALFAFSPNLLAHTRLVTTDLAVTALVFAAFYFYWRYLRRPSWLRLAVAGTAAGLALSSKLSAILLLPLFALLALVDVLLGLRTAPDRSRRVLVRLWHGLLLFAIAGVVVWSFYLFEVRPWPGTRVPLPAITYLLNVRTLIGHAARGHGAFLMGQVSMHGWWYYFPVTLVLKTPLVTLAMVGVAAYDTVRRRRWRGDAPVLLFPAVYFAFTLTSTLNIGFRYILPLVPFLCTFAAKAVSLSWLRPWWLRRRLLPALLTLYAAAALWLHPHYLAFFNVLAGGPGGGYRYLVDSSLDWGQDLKLLKSFLDERGLGQVWLGYFGTADPAFYGIDYEPIFPTGSSRPVEGFAPIDPAPGWYAISATVLQGPFSAEPDVLDWFRRHKPVEKIGYSIFVYRVDSDDEPPGWVGSCYGPDPAVDPAEIPSRFGRDDLRLVAFDCRQTWVSPAGGGPGWYVVPLATDGRGTLAEMALDDAPIVFRERGLRGGIGYTVYRWEGDNQIGIEGAAQEAWASPVLSPRGDEVRWSVPLPADFGGQAALMAFDVSPREVTQGGELTILTSWRVLARPSDPALSLFAHVVGPEGAVAVGDSLGYPPVQWMPGDVFVQLSSLPVARDASAGAHWAQVGLYSLASGERLLVQRGREVPVDRLLLAPVAVQEADR